MVKENTKKEEALVAWYQVTFSMMNPRNIIETFTIQGAVLAELPKQAEVAQEALSKMGYTAVSNAVAPAQGAKAASDTSKQWYKASEVEWEDEDTPLCPLHHKPMRLSDYKPKYGDRMWYCTFKGDPVKDGDYCNRKVAK